MQRGPLTRLAEVARASRQELGLLALLAGLVLAGAAFIYARTSSGPPPPIKVAVAQSVAPAKQLVVHVAGKVASPGVYTLSDGSRIKDAIAAAGGPIEGADVDALNLAALLVDGQKIVVPAVGQAPAVASESSGAQSNGKLNLNLATQSQLEDLPGLGPVTAGRIIAYREKKGRFTSIRQLLEVDGIGPKKFDGIKDLVVV